MLGKKIYMTQIKYSIEYWTEYSMFSSCQLLPTSLLINGTVNLCVYCLLLLHLLCWLNLTIMGLRERNNRINNWNEPSMSLWSLLFALFTYSNNPGLTTKLSSPNDSSDTSEAIWILWLHSVLLLINSQREVFSYQSLFPIKFPSYVPLKEILISWM